METQNESTAEKITTRSVGTRYGLYMGGFAIVWFLVMALSGMKLDGPGRWVSAVASAVLIFLAHKNYKDNGNGYMSFGEGVGIAFWISAVSSVISSVFTFIYVKFVDSGFIDMIKESQLQAMQEKGMSDEQIEQAMKFASMFTTPTAMFLFGLFFGILFGVIIGLIISIFTQKKNPEALVN